jgi:hypothetical protein
MTCGTVARLRPFGLDVRRRKEHLERCDNLCVLVGENVRFATRMISPLLSLLPTWLSQNSMTVHVQGISESFVELSVRIFAVPAPGYDLRQAADLAPSSTRCAQKWSYSRFSSSLIVPEQSSGGTSTTCAEGQTVPVRRFELRVWLSSRGLLFFFP